MPEFDWNNNGKKDVFDQYMDMKVMSDESSDDTDDFDLDDEDIDILDIDDLDDDEEKYTWRENYLFDYEIDPEDYETEEEYLEALEMERSNKKVSELSITKESSVKNQINTNMNNSKIYKFCKVKLDSIHKQYDYLCGDLEINVNDSVLIPFGKQNEHIKGTIVAVGKCLECAFNTSVDNMKCVLKVLNKVNNTLSIPAEKPTDNIVYEDDYIKISWIKWQRINYLLLGGNALAGTFLFENKYDKRFCIYFKDISIGGFLNQEESSSIALSGKQKQLKEVPFAFDAKIPEDLKNYNEIEFRICYGRIKEGYSTSSFIDQPLIKSDIIIWKL